MYFVGTNLSAITSEILKFTTKKKAYMKNDVDTLLEVFKKGEKRMTKEDAEDYIKTWCPYSQVNAIIAALSHTWIPIKTRPMTEEETEHYFEYIEQRVDDAYTILDCPLPEDGQEVLVSSDNSVSVDIFIRDNESCYFENYDISEVDAWMSLPEPWKGEKH